MKYILCTPDVTVATYEDCEKINQVMERLKSQIEIESDLTFYKLYSAPSNCRKYRVYLDEVHLWKDIENKKKILYSAFKDNAEREAMSCCMYYLGDAGAVENLSNYIKSAETKQKYDEIGKIAEQLAA